MSIEITLNSSSSRKTVLYPSVKDIRLVENLKVDEARKKEKLNGVLVTKPWGAEYMCGNNKNVELWELYIKQKCGTSLHCHPDKDTLNIVLNGKIMLKTINGGELLKTGDFRILKAGTIHKSSNLSDNNIARILEIEFPPNKYNLIRVKDDYGREVLGYEGRTRSNDMAEIQKFNRCLDKDKINFSGFRIKNFIENSSKGLNLYELELKKVIFGGDIQDLLKKIKELSLKNLIVMDGSLSLNRNNKCFKLLAGKCAINVPLEKYNWSAHYLRAIIW